MSASGRAPTPAPLGQWRIILQRGDRFVAVEVSHISMDTIVAMERALTEHFRIETGEIATAADIEAAFTASSPAKK